ncbi:nucleoside hydrolase [Rhizobium puerariae]|uniref:Nucleoside hydrolase n=1 Tax=Rhizobium puerariae TaxID=1585791 RepID=A0ABV6AI37_9HYPH
MQRIILDCDPGVDDALALMLALAAPEKIDLAGVTTVAGNVPLESTTGNARGLLALAGRADIPVHAGCARPLMRAVGHRSIMHGTEGLGGVRLEPDTVPLGSAHAVDFIIDTVMANPSAITLCPIGPLTNMALAMVKEPRLADNIREIVFMGGAAFGPGNTTAAAEFNIYVDPHAAHIVLSSGVKLTMFGLDVTRTVVVDQEYLKALETSAGHIRRKLALMLRAYAKGDPCLHDPCVIAWLIDPSLFSGTDAFVEVDCATGPNHGRTIAHVSERHRAGREPNCHVVTGAAKENVLELLSRHLSRLEPQT